MRFWAGCHTSVEAVGEHSSRQSVATGSLRVQHHPSGILPYRQVLAARPNDDRMRKIRVFKPITDVAHAHEYTEWREGYFPLDV
jgi:hypothetical protein